MSFTRCSTIRLGLFTALALVTAWSGSARQTAIAGEPDATMDTLVSAEWLNRHLDDPDLVVLDCSVRVEQAEDGSMRSVSARDEYETGHIPTAGFADLKGELSDADSPLEFALPTPERFAAVMGALGVGDDSRVVLYSGNNSVWAARVWWMLRWIGFDRAALLDGGLAAWTAEGYPLSTAAATRPAGTLAVHLRPELIADRDEVLASIGNPDVNLIDVLPEAHYLGDVAMYARPGHIPGASNVPVFSLVDDAGRYRPDDELEMIFDADPANRVITYCGGGIAASSVAFALTRAGYTDVAIYAASLEEWAADPAAPMETGTESAKPAR